MQTISCDVCRKKVEDSITGRSFFYFAQFNVCEACKDNLEVQIKSTIRNKDPFSYDWYNKLVVDNLNKSVSRGR
ncbi:MAG: hypothetical protein LBC80_08295 [Treponema sp.]|jgi:hypothetical protein|nr:hypothetical protein [Treponema sp.]